MKQTSRYLKPEEKDKIETLFTAHQDKLRDYIDVLLWWNKKINLVSRDVPRETVVEHIKHSLYISIVAEFLESDSLIDAGAGGGLPGLPLSLCFNKKSFLVNDIVAKKVFSVNDMINKLGVSDSVSGLVGDIRAVEVKAGSVIITKHAFGLDQLYDMVKDKPWKSIVFLKGYEEAGREAESVSDQIDLNIIKLDPPFMNSFYKGKAIVELKRLSNE